MKCPDCGYEIKDDEIESHFKDIQKNIKEREKELEDEKKGFNENKNQIEKDAELKAKKEYEKQKKQDKGKIQDEERKKIKEENDAKSQNKDAEIEDLKDQNQKKSKMLQRNQKEIKSLLTKSQQVPSELQGAIQEDQIGKLLESIFKDKADTIIKVDRGIKGADYIQDVIDKNGDLLGRIAYESKNTKFFQENYKNTLLSNLSLPGVEARIGIIITKTKPKKQIYNTDWYFNNQICISKMEKDSISAVAKQARIMVEAQYKFETKKTSGEKSKTLKYFESSDFKKDWTEKEIIKKEQRDLITFKEKQEQTWNKKFKNSLDASENIDNKLYSNITDKIEHLDDEPDDDDDKKK